MIAQELINPKSIVVVGASNDVEKPGGRVLENLKKGPFKGELRTVNPKESEVQGIKCYAKVEDLPQTDLAIISIAAKFTLQTVEVLAKEKGTRGFIILSAGFSEMGKEGAELENKIVEIINSVNGSLIGPNCIGLLTHNHSSIFTLPVPDLAPDGVDFVTGSGATAVFILETAIPRGLRFASLYSVGNSAQIGVEDVLEYWDEIYEEGKSPKVKMIYVESVNEPQKFYKAASSLIRKGCRITAIKAGATEAGARAASSHTGALASSDTAVDALFRKAGIVRCNSRDELVSVAIAMTYKKMKGDNVAVVTHAGGPGVMLSDWLSNGGYKTPKIEGEAGKELLEKLFAGSSIANPIDFLATGTAEQLGIILDYVDKKFDYLDGSAVIYGTPGLFDITPAYKVLLEKLDACDKPIFPILPCPIVAKNAVNYFTSQGKAYFSDEAQLGIALTKIKKYENAPKIEPSAEINAKRIREIIDESENGYLIPEKVGELLDCALIPRAKECSTDKIETAVKFAEEIGFPLVMKVVGPVHKSDVGGVVLNVDSIEKVKAEFARLMQIKDATAVLMQSQLSGLEIYAGAKKEGKFGHLVMFGLGGIFIEVLKDVAAALVPVGKAEALNLIRQLKSYKLIQGVRGKEGANEEIFAEIIWKLSSLLACAPEISEMDINPLLGRKDSVVAVDARIRIEK